MEQERGRPRTACRSHIRHRAEQAPGQNLFPLCAPLFSSMFTSSSKCSDFQALCPEGFYLEWERFGQQSDQMTPAQEALCAVMEAWAAKTSDSPAVLDLPADRAALAPKGEHTYLTDG